jgi:tape measure domain-containing protein
MSDVEIVVGIRGDISGGRTIKRSLDDIAASGQKAAVSTDFFKKELASGQITIQKFTDKMNNAGQSAKTIKTEVDKLGITQKAINRIIQEGVSPLERLNQKQAEYNKYLRAGAIDQKTFEKATAQNTEAIKRLKNESSIATKIFGELKTVVAGYIGIQSIKQTAMISDQYVMMNARLKTITGSTNGAADAVRELKRISSETGVAMSANIDIMQRLSFVREEINATNKDMLTFTETVSKIGVLSNASGEALKNGLTQLGQSLSAEIMRAEEFNSVMENTPGIGKAIADQFGVTTGQLGRLVREGKVLSSDVFSAILNQTEKVREEMEKMPRTIERAGKEAGITFDGLIAKIMGTTDAASGYVKIIDFGTNRLKEMTATVDIIRISFEFMGDRIATTFNNIAYEMEQIYNKASGFIYKLTSGKVDLGVSSDYYKRGYSQTLEQNNAAKSNAVRSVMGEQFGPFKPQEKREISQNYAEIAAGLSSNTKLTKAQSEALKAQKKIQDQLNGAIKDSRTETEQLYDKIAEQERLKPFAKTTEQANAISKNIKAARDELEKLRVKAELNGPVAKAFASLASEIDDGFKDAFKDAFTQSDGGFKALLNGWKNTFKNFLAELAYQALMRPIVVSVVGALGGTMGLSGNAVASVLGGSSGGSAGGLGGIGNLSSMLGGLQNLLSGGTSSTLISGVNKLGSLLGIGGVGANGPVSLSSFSSFTNGSFGGSLGAGLGSFGGNFLANSLFGNRGIGANIGGTIGGIAGSFIPIPIAGPLIGSFLGNALGGLFGGSKPSDKTQGGSINLATLEKTTNGMTGSKFSQENADFRDKFFTEVENVVNLLKSVGGTTTGQLDVAIGNRDGLRLNDMTSGRNFGNDANAFVKAAMEVVVKQTTGLSETFQKILDKIGVGDTQKLAAAFSFGQFYESLTAEPVDILKEAVDALNAQFDEMRKMATELGFPLDKINEAYETQKTTIEGSIKAQMAGFQSLQDMTNAFKSFLDSQALGSNSSLSPTQKLQLAQDNFGSLLSKAQGGDMSVTQDLLKAASELLNIGRGVYASSVSFAGLESFVRSSVTEIARAAGVPGYATGTDYAASGMAMVGERGRELVRMRGGEQVYTAGETAGIMAVSGNVATDVVRTNAQVVNAQNETNEETKAMRRDIIMMRKQIERLCNKLAVGA